MSLQKLKPKKSMEITSPSKGNPGPGEKAPDLRNLGPEDEGVKIGNPLRGKTTHKAEGEGDPKRPYNEGGRQGS